jgi:hypothetical protein
MFIYISNVIKLHNRRNQHFLFAWHVVSVLTVSVITYECCVCVLLYDTIILNYYINHNESRKENLNFPVIF